MVTWEFVIGVIAVSFLSAAIAVPWVILLIRSDEKRWEAHS